MKLFVEVMPRAVMGLLFTYLVSPAFINKGVAYVTAEPTKLSSETQPSRKAHLIFQSDISLESNPLPGDTTLFELSQFFHNPDSRKAFASGGDIDNTEELAITPEWQARWEKCCERWYGKELMPQKGDSLFRCDQYSKFPGLTVCTTVYTGFKTLAHSHDHNNPHLLGPAAHHQHNRHGMPSCCFVMIGQKQTATGLPPIVWLFHQIMGIKPTSKSRKSDKLVGGTEAAAEPWGPSKSIFTVEQKQAGHWAFRLDTNMKIKLEFPALLLKMLPSSREKAEAQGSASISKTVAKASQKGMDAVHKAFLDFRHRHGHQKEKDMGG